VATTPEPLTPADLPFVRHELEEWLAGGAADVFLGQMLRGSVSFVVPTWLRWQPPELVAAGLAKAELDRVRRAELFFASAEMTELAMQAGSSIPVFSLRAHELPAPAGFVVFGQPIGEAERTLPEHLGIAETPVVAAAWGPYQDIGPAGVVDGVWITYYADASHEKARQLLAAKRARERAELGRLYGHGPLALEREQVVAFSESMPWPTALDDAAEIYGMPLSEVAGVERMLRTLVATWLLMGQTITTEERITAGASRTERKRLARLGIEDVGIRLITLRRWSARKAPAVSSCNGSSSGRLYHHRWPVSGHWRDQPYRARGYRRWIFIDEHIAGPEGAPLIGGHRIKVLKRLPDPEVDVRSSGAPGGAPG
jgi:hypothetical protein